MQDVMENVADNHSRPHAPSRFYLLRRLKNYSVGRFQSLDQKTLNLSSIGGKRVVVLFREKLDDRVYRKTARNFSGGMEGLVGVPGSVGGALR